MHIMFTVEQGTVAGDIQEWSPEHCNTSRPGQAVTFNTINHPQHTLFIFTISFCPSRFPDLLYIWTLAL